ncbi:MAG: chloride channel protein [Acidobacteriota bacterium]|nr:chloride channel protein [Acidobacteriota bacterium]NLT32698.1 tetratricopeptide repeat protein [Acidobacteriota bacterium]
MNRSLHHRQGWKALFGRMDVRQLEQHEEKVLFILTLMIGAAVGLVIVAFIVLTENLGSRMYPAGGAAWRRFLVPTAGSLVTGFLLVRYFRDARGSGIPQTKAALFLHSGVIRLRTVIGKFICSSISLASGIALGREGPSVQIGAGIASAMGRQFGLSPEKTLTLVPIGASAALAAAFNTPIAAVLFTLEEVMGDLHARVLGAIVISSATSWMVLHLLLGDEPLFHVPAYQLVHPVEFILYAALGALGALVSTLFIRLLLRLRHYFLRMPAWTSWLQPSAGGLVVGILGLFVPAVLGVGYGYVSEALNSRMALGTMALLVVLKLVATACCYSSGNAGGIFGPSLFIGAMLGGAFGAGAHMLMPDYTGSVGAYALVGMGVVFAGIVRAPMTSVFMIFEITRNYSIIVPLMVANLTSYFLSSRMQKKPIYEALMHQDGIHLPAAPRAQEEEARVSQEMRAPARVLQGTDRVADILQTLPPDDTAWVVVNRGELMGVVTRRRLLEAAESGGGEKTLAELLSGFGPQRVLTTAEFPHLHPDQSLDAALRQMAASGLDELPVVSRTDPRKLIASLGLKDAMAAYRKEKRGGSAAPAAARRTVSVGRMAVVIALMIALGGGLSWFYRSRRADRALEHAVRGESLMAAGRPEEAVEQFRSALSISHSFRDRLALASALVTARRWNEAEIYFRELGREQPGSGPVNLGLGRIAAQKGNVGEAVAFYRRAVYGTWPEESPLRGLEIRRELVDFLGRSGQAAWVRAELLALAAECPDAPGARMETAGLLLDHALAAEAAAMYREILAENPRDGAAHAGLGRAEYELRNYAEARNSFRSALLQNPGDAVSEARLQVVERILALDPRARGLRPAEKYARSRTLLEAVFASLEGCLGEGGTSTPEAVGERREAARRSLARRGRPRSYGDAVEENLTLAAELWRERMRWCPGAPADEALGLVMERFSE